MLFRSPTLLTKIQQKFDELSGIETQELPSKIEIHAKEYTDSMGNTTKLYSDHLDEIIRDNLNLDRELPEDVFMNSDGITGQANPEKYARLNHDGLLIQGGAIRIVRPDGAVYMQDGIVNQDFAITGYDPYLMDEAIGIAQTYAAFWTRGGYYETRTDELDGSVREGVDIRDSSKGYTINFQRYQFIHSARYFVIRLQASSRSTGLDKVRARIYDGDSMEYGIDIENFGGWDALIVDLGTPSYEQLSLDLRIGFLKQWKRPNSNLLNFRISRVFLTDNI